MLLYRREYSHLEAEIEVLKKSSLDSSGIVVGIIRNLLCNLVIGIIFHLLKVGPRQKIQGGNWEGGLLQEPSLRQN